MPAVIEILSKGLGLSIQDFGREGWLRFGVPMGGAMDRHAMTEANRLLGNPEDAPVLEIVHSGAKIHVLADTWLAITGADLGATVKPWRAECIRAGTVLSFPVAASGLFAYIALPGGVATEHWLGSASTDERNGLGVALQNGSIVSSCRSEPSFSIERIAKRLAMPKHCREYPRKVDLGIMQGPQYELFPECACRSLTESIWTVSSRSDRTGFRLEGPKLDVPSSIPSEPVLPGSFQIPGNGQPIITMVDGPTVGGYAKMAILPEVERDRLAQCLPGTKLRLKWID